MEIENEFDPVKAAEVAAGAFGWGVKKNVKKAESGIEQVPEEPAEWKESIEEFLCLGDDE